MGSELASNITLLGAMITIMMGMGTLTLPRRNAIFPILIVGSFITLGQVLMVGGLHFTMMRIILLFGWARVLLRHEYRGLEPNRIDRIFMAWVLTNVSIYMLRQQSIDAFVNRLGFAYNALGMYFLFRIIIRDQEDIKRIASLFVIILIPLASFMLIENITGRNLFSAFGAVSNNTVIRDGRLRCQGPFTHPILAGTYGATILPLIATRWFRNGAGVVLTLISLFAATVITATSSSSGPLLAYSVGLGGLFLWGYRRRMRLFRWVLASCLIFLHFFMKAPIWFLIGRISEIMGGTGYYRSALIDRAIQYFPEWWLLGSSYTAHWNLIVLPSNPKMVDITNHYIYTGLEGGVFSLILFVWIIVDCYSAIGRFVAQERNGIGKNEAFVAWSLGCVLSAHAISFISVAYFDQMIMFYYLVLAMISVYCGVSGLRPAMEYLHPREAII